MDDSWRRAAACLNVNPNLFFPPRGLSRARRDETETEAIRYCTDCPVRYQCGEEAMTTREDAGVWGRWRGLYRKRARQWGHDCPWCETAMLRGTARMFCSDVCLQAAVEADTADRVLVDKRMDATIDDIRQRERERHRQREARRNSDTTAVGEAAQLALVV